MGILNYIGVNLPDTISIATTPKEVILHSCPSPSTIYDLLIVMTICLTIIFSLVVIGRAVRHCIGANNNAKSEELKARNKQELDKLDKESMWKQRKDRYDSAWRTIEHSWKEGVKEESNPIVEKAWSYIKFFWESEMPEDNGNAGKAKQLES
ncbi:MAG: hypothetical protein DBY35_12805 [Bacteroidales bacterium]|nr:MAG: hypothetical protein DBY35_12805 [Bacteroidales bacterium]